MGIQNVWCVLGSVTWSVRNKIFLEENLWRLEPKSDGSLQKTTKFSKQKKPKDVGTRFLDFFGGVKPSTISSEHPKGLHGQNRRAVGWSFIPKSYRFGQFWFTKPSSQEDAVAQVYGALRGDECVNKYMIWVSLCYWLAGHLVKNLMISVRTCRNLKNHANETLEEPPSPQKWNLRNPKTIPVWHPVFCFDFCVFGIRLSCLGNIPSPRPRGPKETGRKRSMIWDALSRVSQINNLNQMNQDLWYLFGFQNEIVDREHVTEILDVFLWSNEFNLTF